MEVTSKSFFQCFSIKVNAIQIIKGEIMQIQKINGQTNSKINTKQSNQPSFGTYYIPDQKVAIDFFKKLNAPIENHYYMEAKEFWQTLLAKLYQHNTNSQNHILSKDVFKITDVDMIYYDIAKEPFKSTDNYMRDLKPQSILNSPDKAKKTFLEKSNEKVLFNVKFHTGDSFEAATENVNEKINALQNKADKNELKKLTDEFLNFLP